MSYEKLPTGLSDTTDSPCMDIVNETYRQNCLDMGYEAYSKQALEALKPIYGHEIDPKTGLPLGLGSPCMDIVNETYRQNCLDMGYEAYSKQALEALKPIYGHEIDPKTGLPLGLGIETGYDPKTGLPLGFESSSAILPDFLKKALEAQSKLTPEEKSTQMILCNSIGISAGVGTGILIKKETKSTGWAVFWGLVTSAAGYAITNAIYLNSKVKS